MDLKSLKKYECHCKICRSLCDRPCWPTPKEAEAIINAQLGARLMRDYYCNKEKDVFVLCPAIPGYEGKHARFFPTGGCTFQKKNGMCILHDMNLKPLEGRLCGCRKIDVPVHKLIADMWRTRKAVRLVDRWTNDYMKGDQT